MYTHDEGRVWLVRTASKGGTTLVIIYAVPGIKYLQNKYLQEVLIRKYLRLVS